MNLNGEKLDFSVESATDDDDLHGGPGGMDEIGASSMSAFANLQDELETLLKSGYMKKEGLNFPKTWKQRYFECYGDGKMFYWTSHDKHELKGYVSIKRANSVEMLNSSRFDDGYGIKLITNNRIWLFKTFSMSDQKEWADIMQNLMNKFKFHELDEANGDNINGASLERFNQIQFRIDTLFNLNVSNYNLGYNINYHDMGHPNNIRKRQQDAKATVRHLKEIEDKITMQTAQGGFGNNLSPFATVGNGNASSRDNIYGNGISDINGINGNNNKPKLIGLDPTMRTLLNNPDSPFMHEQLSIVSPLSIKDVDKTGNRYHFAMNKKSTSASPGQSKYSGAGSASGSVSVSNRHSRGGSNYNKKNKSSDGSSKNLKDLRDGKGKELRYSRHSRQSQRSKHSSTSKNHKDSEYASVGSETRSDSDYSSESNNNYKDKHKDKNKNKDKDKDKDKYKDKEREKHKETHKHKHQHSRRDRHSKHKKYTKNSNDKYNHASSNYIGSKLSNSLSLGLGDSDVINMNKLSKLTNDDNNDGDDNKDKSSDEYSSDSQSRSRTHTYSSTHTHARTFTRHDTDNTRRTRSGMHSGGDSDDSDQNEDNDNDNSSVDSYERDLTNAHHLGIMDIENVDNIGSIAHSYSADPQIRVTPFYYLLRKIINSDLDKFPPPKLEYCRETQLEYVRRVNEIAMIDDTLEWYHFIQILHDFGFMVLPQAIPHGSKHNALSNVYYTIYNQLITDNYGRLPNPLIFESQDPILLSLFNENIDIHEIISSLLGENAIYPNKVEIIIRFPKSMNDPNLLTHAKATANGNININSNNNNNNKDMGTYDLESDFKNVSELLQNMNISPRMQTQAQAQQQRKRGGHQNSERHINARNRSRTRQVSYDAYEMQFQYQQFMEHLKEKEQEKMNDNNNNNNSSDKKSSKRSTSKSKSKMKYKTVRLSPDTIMNDEGKGHSPSVSQETPQPLQMPRSQNQVSSQVSRAQKRRLPPKVTMEQSNANYNAQHRFSSLLSDYLYDPLPIDTRIDLDTSYITYNTHCMHLKNTFKLLNSLSNNNNNHNNNKNNSSFRNKTRLGRSSKRNEYSKIKNSKSRKQQSSGMLLGLKDRTKNDKRARSHSPMPRSKTARNGTNRKMGNFNFKQQQHSSQDDDSVPRLTHMQNSNIIVSGNKSKDRNYISRRNKDSKTSKNNGNTSKSRIPFLSNFLPSTSDKNSIKNNDIIDDNDISNYTLGVGISLTGCTRDNEGNFCVFPKSHVKMEQALKHDKNTIDFLKDSSRGATILDRIKRVLNTSIDNIGFPTPLLLRSGDVFFTHYNLLHCIQENRYDQTQIFVFAKIHSSMRRNTNNSSKIDTFNSEAMHHLWKEFPGVQKYFSH